MLLYEILVPTVKPDSVPGKNRFFTTKYHKQWDEKVRKITGGLTIGPKLKGQWLSPTGKLFVEPMICVSIACEYDWQIGAIATLLAKHYDQQAVMYWLKSSEVTIKHYK